MNLSNNKILITGGATGVGLGMAERFVRANNKVIICGRRESALREAVSSVPALITRKCDLSDQNERRSLFDWIAKEHNDLNVIVNNAGIQNWMKVTDNDFYLRSKDEIAINVEVPLHLITLALKLKSLNVIINVTSGLAYVPLTKVPVYCATKAFLHSFTISLQSLLKEKNIEVIELIPPALKTDLGGKGLHDFAPPVSDFLDSAFAQLAEGKTRITFGMSDAASKSGPEDIQKFFDRMNQRTVE